jgi:uncharacterized membrane protein
MISELVKSPSGFIWFFFIWFILGICLFFLDIRLLRGRGNHKGKKWFDNRFVAVTIHLLVTLIFAFVCIFFLSSLTFRMEGILLNIIGVVLFIFSILLILPVRGIFPLMDINKFFGLWWAIRLIDKFDDKK